MKAKLPSLIALQAFVVAAKHQSFTKAALELYLTPGAISKQIGILENYLGVALFERRNRNINLTKEAKIYFNAVRRSFENIEQATIDLMRKDNSNSINVSILPSLTDKLLIKMIKDFYPKYQVNIEVGSGYEAVDFDNRNIDIAMRIGKKEKRWPNCVVENIVDERLICVASPAYLKKHPIKTVQDLAKCNLLNNTSRPLMWRDYLKQNGLKKSDLKYPVGFEHFFMLIDAAQDDIGVAMVADFMVKKELEEGSLKIAFKPEFVSGYAYQIIYQKQKINSPKIEVFRKWVKKNLGN